MDIINLDIKKIKEANLTVQEYLTLLYLYVSKTKNKEYKEFIENFGSVSLLLDMGSLEDKNFIKIPSLSLPGECELREPTYKLFEGNKDLFLTWLLTFPVKTPSGRYLSPIGEETKAATTLKKKWKANFGTDTIKMNRVIEILQAEVNWRKKNGSMEYIHNAETWLNQGDWEKYEYLLVSYRAKQQIKNEDYI